jgi:uncharacterized protein YgiM (DUF1202 family)
LILKYLQEKKNLILILAFILLNSCASLNRETESFYCIQTVTYLRECPSNDCHVVAEIYYNDELNLLEEGDNGWWRVQTLDDQKIGWMQRDLLSKIQPPVKRYYIAVDGLPLRSSPSEEVISRHLLAHGDKVQKIAESNGWWRVLVEKDKSIGWIPAALASEELREQLVSEEVEVALTEDSANIADSQPAPNSTYFVAAERLNLHLLPLLASEVVRELKINDKLEKIYQSGPIWIKVRYVDTGVEGWAQTRYLKDAPVTDKNQIVGGKRRPPRASRGKTPPVQDPFESENLEPEGM